METENINIRHSKYNEESTTVNPENGRCGNKFSMTKFGGFTLVELIVVITILVILGTIGFTSMSGFSSNARDATRSSDLANIAKGLDISLVKIGYYPDPDNAFTVTYSGGSLWTQGTLSDTSLTTLNAGGGVKLSKKPTDPLVPSKEYTYSKLFYGNAYQLKSDWEGDSVVFLPSHSFLIPEVSASPGNPTLSYIKGNYNGMVVKTETGSTKYLLAIPSLFLGNNASSGSTVNFSPVSSTGFLLHGQSNSSTGFVFTGVVVYSSGALPSTDAERILFASGIAHAYSGTILANSASIKPFITALSSNSTGSLASLGGGVVSGSLGGSTGGSSSSGGGGAVVTQCSPGSYSATGNTPCTTTTAGYFVTNTGAISQTQCTAGYYCNTGSTSATQNQCPANSWCTIGSGSPTACTGGTTSPVGSVSVGACVTPCPTGATCEAAGIVYSTPGTYSWVVPTGVTSVSVVVVGGGGGGGTSFGPASGGGGGLRYMNNISVSLGQNITIMVGTGGSSGSNGGSSSFGVSVIAYGGSASGNGGGGDGNPGGNGGTGGATGTSGIVTECGGGGGAAGYSGNGGNGGTASAGQNGSGGGGGGGGWLVPGGGVGLYGQGVSGIGGSWTWNAGVGTLYGSLGGGGSGGANGGVNFSAAGGVYGGGGLSISCGDNTPSGGGAGAVRIIWPGTSRQFPSTDVGP